MNIFISHASLDKEVISKFVNYILVLGLGIHYDSIFYTSQDGMKIHLGDSIPKEILSNLKESDFILLMLSDNYKKSEVCLNEMGGAYFLEKPYFPFIIDDTLTYGEVGFLIMDKMIAKISNGTDLDNFKDTVQTLFDHFQNNTSRWNENRGEFLEFVKTYSNKNPDKSKQIEIESHTEITQNEKVVLEAIQGSSTSWETLIGLSVVLRQPQNTIRIILRDLITKGLVYKDSGTRYHLTEDALRNYFL